ncbi:ABC transporter transmembrane domain-containing protein [Streptomyces sp. NPDC059002]|uniref:ABC transporter transmembrane domain-containing protein n=1 Tax=Streptomyces sp. NPDC059002 TaxID=3346690 RepID=UPI0036C94A50
MAASRTNPGTPDRRSAARYLWWVTAAQPQRIATGALFGTVWMICLTLPPYILSRAIDDGLRPGDRGALVGWSMALFGIGVLNAWLAIMRHRTMTRVRLDAYFRTVRVVVDQATRLGAGLSRRVSTGEVVTIGHSDVGVISQTLTATGPGVGAVIAYVVVAALLLSVSVLLAVVVLVGVPLLAVLVGPLLGRLQGAETAYRERQGALAAVLGDLAGGLRILNGLGGKGVFAARYREGSRKLRDEGYRVGSAMSWIQAFGLGLPALFLAAVTWLAARMAAQGTITVGELVAVYGYVAVLVVPVASLIESGYDISRGLVSAGRVVAFLNLEPDPEIVGPVGDRGDTAPTGSADRHGDEVDGPAKPAVLRDPWSGVEVAPGLMTALVSARTSECTDIVDRLGRFAPTDATWGAVRLDAVALDQVRARILVADNEADLFAGTLRSAIAGRGDPDDDALAHAVDAAMARDIVLGLPNGLDSSLDAQGRNLSGGQRQRVRLARALLAHPEVLMLLEPTSAVDAHTEAKMASGLRTARAGRTTLITSTSPLLLDQADVVHYLVDGRLAATGRHADLLTEQPGYRLLVSRGTEGEGGAEGEEPDVLEAPDVPDEGGEPGEKRYRSGCRPDAEPTHEALR